MTGRIGNPSAAPMGKKPAVGPPRISAKMAGESMRGTQYQSTRADVVPDGLQGFAFVGGDDAQFDDMLAELHVDARIARRQRNDRFYAAPMALPRRYTL